MPFGGPQGLLSGHSNAALGGQACVSHGVVVGGPNVITSSGTRPTSRCCRDQPFRVVLSIPPADCRTCYYCTIPHEMPIACCLALQQPAAACFTALLHAYYCSVLEPAVGTPVRLRDDLKTKLLNAWVR
jgi:hypothetical protein